MATLESKRLNVKIPIVKTASIEPAQCVEKLKVLADSVRFSVLKSLLEGPKHVWELMEILKLQQSLVSHHLKVLRENGLIEAHRHGKGVRYQLSPRVKWKKTRKSIELDCCELLF